jgi:hypothetical protein
MLMRGGAACSRSTGVLIRDDRRVHYMYVLMRGMGCLLQECTGVLMRGRAACCRSTGVLIRDDRRVHYMWVLMRGMGCLLQGCTGVLMRGRAACCRGADEGEGLLAAVVLMRGRDCLLGC